MDSSSEDDNDDEVQMYVPFTCSDKRINCRIGMTLENIESGEKFKIHQVVKVRTEDELYYQYYDIEKYQRRPRVYSRFEYTPCEEMLLEEGREGGWVRWLSKGKKRNAISPTISSKRKFDVAIPEPPVFLAIPNHVLLSASAHQTFPSSSLGPAQFVHNPGVAIRLPQRHHRDPALQLLKPAQPESAGRGRIRAHVSLGPSKYRGVRLGRRAWSYAHA